MSSLKDCTDKYKSFKKIDFNTSSCENKSFKKDLKEVEVEPENKKELEKKKKNFFDCFKNLFENDDEFLLFITKFNNINIQFLYKLY